MSAPIPDPVRLTQELIRIPSVNPPGQEEAVMRHLAGILEEHGLTVELLEFAPGRPNLVARLAGDGPPLCLSAHLDTVPLGLAPWSVEPLGAEIKDGKLYGRGSSDMKSGAAALVTAAVETARLANRKAGLLLAFTAGEEHGCQGAHALAAWGGLGPAGALLVGEPTGLTPCLGHKGALWLRGVTRGKTAHASMPHEGDNAIYKAVRAVARLAQLDLGHPPHEVLGPNTLVVGTINGGQNVNSVPDRCSFEVDIRSLPGQSHEDLVARVTQALGPAVELTVTQSADGFYCPPGHPFVTLVQEIHDQVTGRKAAPSGVTYFTDGPVLLETLGGPPTVLLGPGEASQAHRTDEWCLVDNIGQAAEIYRQVCAAWCLGGK